MNKQHAKQEINHILNKFMAGETSLNEEQMLAEYFRTHEVGVEWQEYKEMFALFDVGEVGICLDADIPSRHRGNYAVYRRVPSVVKWFAAAAAVLAALIISTKQFDTSRETDCQHIMCTKPVQKERQMPTRKAPVLPTRTPAPQEKAPAPHKPCETIYTAMLPEIEFCPDSHEAQLPRVSKERSFGLVCKVILPEVTAYTDSTLFQCDTEVMVACDEIEYNDKTL